MASSGAGFILGIAQTTGFPFLQANAAALADPGSWLAAEAVVTGDRRRISTDAGATVNECEVAGTTAAVSAGTQAVDFGAAITGPGATGLVNDGTLYDATVVVDGGSDTILITGSTAQDFDALIVQLDLDTTGGTWSIIGGDLVCTSASTGETSTILITDGPLVNNLLFDTITGFVAILAAVDGDGEPTFPSDGTTVVDGTVTWRDCGRRSMFHDLFGGAGGENGPLLGSVDASDGVWRHYVGVRSTLGVHFYVDGVLVDEELIQLADTGPGSFGLPVKMQFDTADWAGTSMNIGADDGASGLLEGSICFVAIYQGVLTAAQILSHYELGVELGLNQL
jgi:hypothetical protein